MRPFRLSSSGEKRSPNQGECPQCMHLIVLTCGIAALVRRYCIPFGDLCQRSHVAFPVSLFEYTRCLSLCATALSGLAAIHHLRYAGFCFPSGSLQGGASGCRGLPMRYLDRFSCTSMKSRTSTRGVGFHCLSFKGPFHRRVRWSSCSSQSRRAFSFSPAKSAAPSRSCV